VDAGLVVFNTELLNCEGDKVFSFIATGNSYKYYDWIYKVRDRYESKVDSASFQPVWFQRNTYEGGYEVFNQYNFDVDKKRVFYQVKHSGSPLKTDTLHLDPCRFDVLSAAYYARNIDFNLCQPGDKIPVKILIDNEFYETYIRYLGIEVIQNRSGIKYRCHKLSALLVEGTIFKGGEDLIVWITDDQNKIPIMAEAKILIGSVKAYLIDYEGLKYKVDAQVKDTRKK
jgi:hypothetical protein